VGRGKMGPGGIGNGSRARRFDMNGIQEFRGVFEVNPSKAVSPQAFSQSRTLVGITFQLCVGVAQATAKLIPSRFVILGKLLECGKWCGWIGSHVCVMTSLTGVKWYACYFSQKSRNTHFFET